MAGPRGFEPLLSGSGGRRLNPDLATGPPRKLNINFPDKSFYAVGKRGAGSSAWLERPADNRKVESSNLSRPTKFNLKYLELFSVVNCCFIA